MIDRFSLLVICCALVLACSHRDSKDQPQVVASIGPRVISADEFANRAELTPRPFFCRNNTAKDKRIILNNLIAEKLLALESEADNELLENRSFLSWLQGRKEQFMRELLYYQTVDTKVDTGPARIGQMLPLAGLEYDVDFYQLDAEQARVIAGKLTSADSGKVFDAIDLTSEVPGRHVTYFGPEPAQIFNALFTRRREKGTVIGPLQLDDQQFIVLKVRNCAISPAASRTEIVRRRQMVRRKILEMEGLAQWNAFVSSLTAGKNIILNRQAFVKLAELYVKADHFDQRDGENPVRDLPYELEALQDLPLLRVDEEEWLVSDFYALLQRHPLVFRKKNYPPEEFMQQFRLAIIDLVKDEWVTREAYKRGLDRDGTVKRHTEMWQDAYLARYARERYLKHRRQQSDFDPGRMNGKNTYMDEYIAELQKKYAADIKIDFSVLAGISLTDTDMYTAQPFMPYTQAVPQFPMLCITDEIDYGRPLEKPSNK